MNLISGAAAIADLEAHPNKRIFWRSGWAYRGAAEYVMSRDPKNYPKRMTVYPDMRRKEVVFATWQEELQAKFNWACVVNLVRNDDEAIHLNGLSVNDME